MNLYEECDVGRGRQDNTRMTRHFIHIKSEQCGGKAAIAKEFLEFLCGSAEMNLTNIREGTGLIPGLTQWVKDQALL